MYSEGMTTRELGLREARTNLGHIANTAHLRRDVTYLTRNGERIAAVVPVTETEASETTFAVPSDEAHRSGTLAVLSLMRRLANGIVGLQVGEITIDDITDELNAALKRLANQDGELSEEATHAATALSRALDKAINENR
jgi:hypothetical protein